MKKLVGKNFDSESAAFIAAMKWLTSNYACDMADIEQKSFAKSKYAMVKGKAYRVYFFQKEDMTYDAYFFSRPEEALQEIERRKKKAWERQVKHDKKHPFKLSKEVLKPYEEEERRKKEWERIDREVPLPDACEHCSIEPVCETIFGSHLCDHRKEREEYKIKIQEAKRKANI